MQLIELYSKEKTRTKRGLLIVKRSSFLIFIGVVMTLASFLIVWGSTQIVVTKKDYYLSKTLQVSPKGYSYQRINFLRPPGWETHFSFTVEEDNIKCVLLDAYDFVVWYLKGQLSHEWIELSSDFSYWKDGIPETMVSGPMYYLFYNEDSHPKTIYFESFKSKSKITINYLYMNGGFSLLVLGAGTFISGLYKRPPTSINTKLAFVVFGSFYISVLVASYLLAFSYTFFAPYGVFFIPLVANFYIGYFVGDLYTAIKIIIVGSFLQAGIFFALLFSSLISDVFVVVACMHAVPLGIAASFVGMSVREDSSDIIAMCMDLLKKMKQTIETLLSKVRI